MRQRKARRIGMLMATVLLYGLLFTPGVARAETDSFVGRYVSDRLTLKLVAKNDASYSGEIHFNGKTFPAEAHRSADQLRGTFENEGDSFEFTASLDGDALTLNTGGATYHLHRAVDGGADQATVAFTIRDEQPDMRCDAVHLRVPNGWRASGRIGWSMAALSPAKPFIFASNPRGLETWAFYPVQTFVWRDNFDLFGLSFPLKLGDADPVTGEEIERPIENAADCVSQVIVPRFRKDLANARVASTRDYTVEEAHDAVKRFAAWDVMGLNPQLKAVRKAVVVRFEYPLQDKIVQEDVLCVVTYVDLPSQNLGVCHIWQIDYTASFRAEKGKLDDTAKVADAIARSVQLDPEWMKKGSAVQQRIVQSYASRLIALAQARQADIRARANSAIFDMTQASLKRRKALQDEQFNGFSLALNGMGSFKTPDGQTVTAPLAPAGQGVWRGPDGGFKNGATSPGSNYQQLTPQ